MTACSMCTYWQGGLRGLARKAENARRRGRTPTAEVLAEIEETKALIKQCSDEGHVTHLARVEHIAETRRNRTGPAS